MSTAPEVHAPPAVLLQDFCRSLRTLGRSERTQRSYRERIGPYLRHLEESGLHPCDAGHAELAAYHDALRARGVKTSSQVSILATLRVFYAYLARAGHITTPPLIELPKSRRQPPTHVMTPRQVLRLLAQPDCRRLTGIRDRAMLELLYSTAMRIGELRALQVGSVDFESGFVRIERGKGGKGRVVPIGRTALDWTRRYLTQVRPLFCESSRQLTLFMGARREPISYSHFRDLLASYGEAARIPFRISAHALRHAAATHLLRGDGERSRAGLVVVRDILGHASCDTTQLYTRIEITDLERELSARHFRDRRASRRR